MISLCVDFVVGLLFADDCLRHDSHLLHDCLLLVFVGCTCIDSSQSASVPFDSGPDGCHQQNL